MIERQAGKLQDNDVDEENTPEGKTLKRKGNEKHRKKTTVMTTHATNRDGNNKDTPKKKKGMMKNTTSQTP